MNLPANISDRELIDSLFGRIECIEGALRLYRDFAAAIAASSPLPMRQACAETLALLKADTLTTFHHQQGVGLRPAQVQAANQRIGFEVEWRQLAALLQDNAPAG